MTSENLKLLSDDEAMSLAIAEASKGAGFVSPNPQVGCVILGRDGRLLATGYHEIYGGPHAEVEALKGLNSEDVRDARMFVTLEPCAHEGKTPSCAKAIALLPLKQVIYGLVDPNPLVAGQGAQIIRAAGISATEYQGPLKEELEQVCEHFLVNFRENRPFVSLKVASSLDGQMALSSGESKWITGEESREQAHYLRAIHEAVLVGQGTLETDNPSLDIRHPQFPGKRNKVIILLGSNISNLRPSDLNILKTHTEDEVFFLQKTGLSDGGEFYQRLIISPSGALGIPPQPEFYDHKFMRRDTKSKLVASILVEGGARVLSSFINELGADRLYLFQAPILLGAKGGKAWTEGVKIDSMGERISVGNSKLQRFGSDLLLTGKLPRVAAEMATEQVRGIMEMKWVRSKNGWFAGVCQGLGDRFGIEVWILRALWILSFFWFGTGLLVYLLMAICLPREDKLVEAMGRRALGVCTMIASRYEVEVGLVRLLAVFLGLSSFGLAIFLYVILYFVLPREVARLASRR
jgi:diaminohydroxyphosphoribosylaminopyrimidine deaminase/5-amino-6-(5-phosphoribosylamino)uracil reductase